MNASVRTSRARRALASIARGVEAIAVGALQDAAERTLADAKSTPAFHDRSGKTRESFRIVRIGPTRLRFKAGGVSLWLNDGTRPHTIRAKNASTLRFVVNGTVIFRRMVRHPGTKPTHFVDHARAEGEARLGEEMHERLERLFRSGG